jgi:hypothetical protein
MRKGVGYIVGGGIAAILGLSGQFALRGTNSPLLLVLFGLVLVAVGIGTALSGKSRTPVFVSAKKAAPGEEAGRADQEIVLAACSATDPTWGGFLRLFFTDKGIIADWTTSASASTDEAIDAAAVLALEKKNFVIRFDEIAKVALKRKALPIGHSRIKVKSAKKNINYAFRRESFDEVSSTLGKFLQGKLTVS